MDHSEPILASFEALPDMLTAKDLEAVLQIDRKTIYAYVQRGRIPYVRIESNVRFSTRSCAGCKSAASSPDRCMERAPSANEESAAGMTKPSPAASSSKARRSKREKPRPAIGAFCISIDFAQPWEHNPPTSR